MGLREDFDKLMQAIAAKQHNTQQVIVVHPDIYKQIQTMSISGSISSKYYVPPDLPKDQYEVTIEL